MVESDGASEEWGDDLGDWATAGMSSVIAKVEAMATPKATRCMRDADPDI
jgi:hypothetical protein